MKSNIGKIIALAVIALTSTFAFSGQECGIIINYPPGGSSDMYVRTMQKSNPDIRVEYKPGNVAISMAYMREHKDYAYFGSPVMFSKTDSEEDKQVDMLTALIGSPILGMTNKGITLDDLMTKKVNVGVPALNTAHHMVALQLQELNPNIQIVPTKGDNNALPLLMNKDLDFYLVSSSGARNWVQDYKLHQDFELPFNKGLKKGKLTLLNVGFSGIFMSKDATPAQKEHMSECIRKATNNKFWDDSITSMNVTPLHVSDEASKKMMKQYVDFLKKYDL